MSIKSNKFVLCTIFGSAVISAFCKKWNKENPDGLKANPFIVKVILLGCIYARTTMFDEARFLYHLRVFNKRYNEGWILQNVMDEFVIGGLLVRKEGKLILTDRALRMAMEYENFSMEYFSPGGKYEFMREKLPSKRNQKLIP